MERRTFLLAALAPLFAPILYEYEAKWALQAAIEKYNFRVEELGPAFRDAIVRSYCSDI